MGYVVIGALALVLVLAGTGVRRRYRLVTVRGESMWPTLDDGDRVLVRRCGLADLRAGDIVVCGLPGGGAILLLDRGSGTRSESPWLVKRVVALPGQPVPEDVRPAVDADRVPAGRMVVRGDGQLSRDSRQFGFVPAERLLGRVPTRAGSRGRAEAGTR